MCIRDRLTSHHLLEVRLVHLHVFRQIKNLENVLVILKSDGSQPVSYTHLDVYKRQSLYTFVLE